VQVIERIQTFIRLNIKKNAKVSQLFDFFEKKKEELSIQQYTVKQASVEQIFNRFADNNEAS
jgi:ATP-binding cassette, subfamily A (ABC1), member 3